MSTSISFKTTEKASKRIIDLTNKKNIPPLFRIRVNGGGCSGFQYEFDFIETQDDITENDTLFKSDFDATIVIDDISANFLNGCTLDFKDELIGSYFSVINPNATASCGCGTSFSI